MATFDTLLLKTKFLHNQGNWHLSDKDILDIRIYRQISLRSFSELLSKKQFFVSRRNYFSDYHEKDCYTQLLYSFSHPHCVGQSVTNAELTTWKERDIAYNPYISIAPISCWSINGEDRFMRWKTYDHGGIEVFLETSVSKLLNSLSCEDYEVFVSKVNYDRRNLFQPEHAVLFCKENGYKDEEELRFCFIEKDIPEKESGLRIPIKNIDFIDSVTIASLHNRSDAIGVFNILNEIAAIRGKVRLSSIIEYS